MNPVMTLVLMVGISTVSNSDKEPVPWNLNKDQKEQLLELFLADEESVTPEGVVTLIYKFDSDEPEKADNFFPPVSFAPNAKIKWADHRWGYSRLYHEGVVIADKGEWFHEAVWEPSVIMDVDFVSFTTGNPSRKDLVAATYAWSKKNRRRVGSNLGTQLVRLSGVKASGKQGKAAPLVHEERSRFGFQMKNGTFTTRQMGSSRESTSSRKLLKDLSAGQVGLVWSGGVSGVVDEIRITGRLNLDWVRKQLPEFDPIPATAKVDSGGQ
ncbi:MAG: hypothetical protein CBC13_11840 [Planctomycetia bacterium TMED53]|nr:MAG: hypothetical protein CBC13_11840 [Planctomycetia bacterium TMED53]